MIRQDNAFALSVLEKAKILFAFIRIRRELSFRLEPKKVTTAVTSAGKFSYHIQYAIANGGQFGASNLPISRLVLLKT